MRFQMNTVIHMREPSRIWCALEASLRYATIESARTGRQIVLRGLGPSSVSMNHDDFTIITIEEQQNALFIKSDIYFDGSYLGDSAGHEEAVRSKLNRAFDEIQRQFDLEEMQEPNVSAVAETPVPTDGPAGWADDRREMPAAASIEALPSSNRRAEPENHVPALNPHVVNPARRLRDISSFRHFRYVAASSALALILAGIDGAEMYFHRERVVASPTSLRLAVEQRDAKSSGIEAQAVSATIPTQSRDHSEDPKTLLKRWEGAMRTRDAAAQSSFYADPVDRYQRQAYVSRRVLEQEKEEAIEDRKGLWTVKLEGIVIESQSKDEARVRLVKHFFERKAPFHVSERFIRTRLLLKRMGGDWKIASERDFAESTYPSRPEFTTSTAGSGY